MNKTILIIGVGQIGSRHLQGILKTDKPLYVYVVDPSIDSLNIARERAAEITHIHEVYFKADWDGLPSLIDLCIVATSANVREKIVRKLLEDFTIDYLVLEKVLFQEMAAYQIIKELFEIKKQKAWVNHPRRMFASYQQLKKRLSNDHNKTYHIVGGNWGLGCNALHFIDLIVYLEESDLKQLDSDWIDNIVQPSKRNGYVEFTGTIKGILNNGTVFTVTSFAAEASPITISIFAGESRFIIQEGGTPQVYQLERSNDFGQNRFPFVMEFQSDLSKQLVIDFFEKGICYLPSYKEAFCSHEIFVGSLLNKYTAITGFEVTALPIT